MASSAARRKTDRLEFERRFWSVGSWPVAGVDEVGRGPLAGPVMAAAVILPSDWVEGGMPEALAGVDDSKRLSASQREHLYGLLVSEPGVSYGIAEVDVATIDRVNILQATHSAMRQALERLGVLVAHVLVDGLPVAALGWPQTAIVRGDSMSYSIAAASILAKVTRDRQMTEWDAKYPGYGFAGHKGYGTAAHLEALGRLGPCPIHRRSFMPLKQMELPFLGPAL